MRGATNRILPGIVAGLVLIGFSSCDLFSTRSTEPPFMSGSPWIPPTQVEQLFVNLSQAVTELNSDHYLRCFFGPEEEDFSFQFIPNPNAVGWPTTEIWDYEDESRTIEYLFSLMSDDSPGYLAFGEGEKLVYGNEDSVWVTKPYTLVIPVSEPTQTLPQEVSGTAYFYLAQTSIGYWAIYRWEDIEGSPSWTDLKAWLY